ncbi:MAG TPA: class I SAM-dependent methyltransferase [Pirellulaceae bacterium]|nr:class I SAM-dependent methyltransferase [Pirellulaceae bacterium]
MSPAIRQFVRHSAEQLLQNLKAIEGDLAGGDLQQHYAAVKAVLDECLAGLDSLGLRGPDNRLPSSELWNVAGDVLQRGWLQNQARTKPRGYAGDFEMLARIYENRLCEDPLGRLFDRYFQEEAAPRAVRHRMAMMTEWIVDLVRNSPSPPTSLPQGARGARIAVVGSAFGLEVRDALMRLDESERQRLSVTLLDLDPSAIEYARDSLQGLIGEDRLTAVSANLFRLPDRPALAAPLNESDLLLCPGLFDYLDKAAAAAMLRTFWERLAPGGRVAVFQFAPHNPTRTYMEWLGNWYLTYRTSDELAHLAAAAGLPAECVEFSSEPLGVDLLLVATQKGSGVNCDNGLP